MKNYTIIALLGILFIATACPSPRHDSELKRLQDNNMNLPDLEKDHFNGISFMLSSMFDHDYENNYVLTDNARTKVIYGLDLNFSVEFFDSDEAELIRYAFDDKIDALNAVHDNYILRRQASLFDHSSSIKKELPKSVHFPGYVQVVNGSTYSYDDESAYFTATIEVDETYYVFQLIGKKENMSYLYDDFEHILQSIEK